MDALGLAFLLFMIAFLLIPVGMLALRMAWRVVYARSPGGLRPVQGESRTMVAYLFLQVAAIGLGVYVVDAIGYVGVPVLVVYFATRVLTLPNYVIASAERCQRCRYSMAGLGADRCPECGAAFMPVKRIDL